MEQQFSIGIWNDRPRPHVIWMEPWGADYTLLPNQKLLVTASDSSSGSGPWFLLVETEGNTQVTVERGSVRPKLTRTPRFPVCRVVVDFVRSIVRAVFGRRLEHGSYPFDEIEIGLYPLVQIDGVDVECGHNRQAAIDAGIWH